MLLHTTDNNNSENDPLQYFCITHFQNHKFINTMKCAQLTVLFGLLLPSGVHLIWGLYPAIRNVQMNSILMPTNSPFAVTVWKWKIWHLLKCFSFTSAQRALLTVSDMLVSWGLIKDGYIGSPLQCYLLTGSRPIQSLLLQDAQHLPESIAKD
jgi:hypothetical protein